MEVIICFRCEDSEFSDSFQYLISLSFFSLVDDADELVIEELQRTF